MVPTPMNINNNNNKNEAVSMNINRLNSNLPRKQINSTRSSPIKETDLIIRVKLPEKTVQQLKRIMLITNRKGYEYMGTIDMSRSVNRDIVFNPPTRQTSGNRNTITGNYSAIDDAYLSYHSHPGVEGYFTLPSKNDLIRYMEYYPRMQANIILDRHGYYVIDFIETRKNDRPNKKFVLDEYEKTVGKSAFKKIEHVMRNTVYYKTHLGKWKKIIENEFSNTKGISIKYYGYNQRAIITLVNKDLFPVYNNTRR